MYSLKKLFSLIIICFLFSVNISQAADTIRASYYGKEFHGRTTASGEKYNMFAFTAANKVLPFGTKVKLTNPTNGKSVVVKINDRGPFIKGRDFDLSVGAAKQIEMIKHGVLDLNVEVLNDES